ncbi:54S ribosomal protein L12, mitochondrial [Balamuthia mandrillaris]
MLSRSRTGLSLCRFSSVGKPYNRAAALASSSLSHHLASPMMYTTNARGEESIKEVDSRLDNFVDTQWDVVKDWDQYTFPPKIVKLVDQLLALNQLENLELTKLMQRRLGIPDSALQGGSVVYAAPAAGAPAPGGAAPAGGAAAEAEKKDAAAAANAVVTLELTAVNEADKFKVLKEVRALIPGMKLMESKEKVEKLPSKLKEGVTREEAEKIVAKFKEAGGTVVIKS